MRLVWRWFVFWNVARKIVETDDVSEIPTASIKHFWNVGQFNRTTRRNIPFLGDEAKQIYEYIVEWAGRWDLTQSLD
jgi:hypothetical protein